MSRPYTFIMQAVRSALDPSREMRSVWIVSLATALGVSIVSTSGALFGGVMIGEVETIRPSFFRWPIIYWGAWGILAPFIYRLSIDNMLDAGTWKRSLARLLGGALIFAFLHVLLEAASMRLVPDYRDLHGGTYLGAVVAHTDRSILANLATYAVIVAIAQGLGNYRRYKQEETNAAHLQTAAARSELLALRMQLHPHFLFNTLHSISTLMHRDVDEADRMLLKLSDLLRRIIESTRTQKVTLSEELTFLRAYLDIEQVRFGDRLTVAYDVAEDAAGEEIPNLILQPLIENAIRHGFQPSGRPFVLTIRGRTSGDRLTVDVSDNGAGLPDRFDETDYGIGLRLTRDRLRLLYGPAAMLTLARAASGGTSARIELPTVD